MTKNNDQIEFLPLTQDLKGALQKLQNLFESFPFNRNSKYFTSLMNYNFYNSYNSNFWQHIIKEMDRLGLINLNLFKSRELDFFKNELNQTAFNNKKLTEMFFDGILTNLIKIPDNLENKKYQETPAYHIFSEFIFILYRILLPDGKNWKDFLSDPHESGANFYYFFRFQIKHISELWKQSIISKKNNILHDFIQNLGSNEKEKILTIFGKAKIGISREEKQEAKQIIIKIRNKQLQAKIPSEYLSEYGDIYELYENEINKLDENFKESNYLFKNPSLLPISSEFGVSIPKILEKNLVKFGYEPNEILIPLDVEDNIEVIYKFSDNIKILFTPDEFRKEINDILSLFWGNSNIQLDADGKLRYFGKSLENIEFRLMIESLTKHKFASLIPSFDLILKNIDEKEWNDVARNSRTLLEDFIRLVLDHTNIQYNHKDALDKLVNNLIGINKENLKKCFKFPKYCISNPFSDFHHFVLGLKTVGILTNPPSHTRTFNINRKDALSIKNFTFMAIFTLSNFMK